VMSVPISDDIAVAAHAGRRVPVEVAIDEIGVGGIFHIRGYLCGHSRKRGVINSPASSGAAGLKCQSVSQQERRLRGGILSRGGGIKIRRRDGRRVCFDELRAHCAKVGSGRLSKPRLTPW